MLNFKIRTPYLSVKIFYFRMLAINLISSYTEIVHNIQSTKNIFNEYRLDQLELAA